MPRTVSKSNPFSPITIPRQRLTLCEDVRSTHQNHSDTGGPPAMQLAQSIQRWIASTSEADEDDMGDVPETRTIEKTARGDLSSISYLFAVMPY